MNFTMKITIVMCNRLIKWKKNHRCENIEADYLINQSAESFPTENNHKSSSCRWIDAFHVEMPMKSYQMTSDHCLFERFNGRPNDIGKIIRDVVCRVLAIDMRIYLNLFRWAREPQTKFLLISFDWICDEHVMEMSLHWYAFNWKIFLWPTLNAITMTAFPLTMYVVETDHWLVLLLQLLANANVNWSHKF